MIGRILDKAIGVFAPGSAAKRMAARATMSQLESLTSGGGGYQAGKFNRLTKSQRGSNVSENGIPSGQADQLAWLAWDMYRNNPHVRKICRTIESKVIGRGLSPLSKAVSGDGTANVAFRERARDVWADACCDIDVQGRPGQGGQCFTDLAKCALRSAILTGDVLYRLRPVDPVSDAFDEHRSPVQLQLIHSGRLTDRDAEPRPGNALYRGIEVDARGRRVAYWLLDHHPSDLRSTRQQTRRIPANEIGHLFWSDDVEQMRGTSWLAAAILSLRDVGNYQAHELTAAEMGSCVVFGVKRPSGTSQFGANLPSEWDLTDADGNKLTAFTPGMVLDLGRDGEVVNVNPNRPSSNADVFISHVLRAAGLALPGVKPSTITGDYRQASFSSERSADNDSWPEIEGIQDWFAAGFCQPIYEAVIREAVLAGLFDDVVTPGEFASDHRNYTACDWQGPVCRSINPTDDAKAATMRIANGTSSLQVECSRLGLNWRDVLKQADEVQQFATSLGLDEMLVKQFMGMNASLQAAEQQAEMTAQQQEESNASQAA